MDIDPKAPGNISQNGVNSGTDDELGFDPESPDLADPAVDPLHPARTDEQSDELPVDEDEDLPAGGGAI